MSDIDNTIDTLKEQVEALQADNEQLREANSEWSELANDYDIDTLTSFLQDVDLDDARNLFNQHDMSEISEALEFVSNHDIEEIENALRYNDIDDLVQAYNKIDECGDPEDLAERIEQLEEELNEYTSGDKGLEDLAAAVTQEQHAAVVAEVERLKTLFEDVSSFLTYITRAAKKETT